jgi:hypothetical protein
LACCLINLHVADYVDFHPDNAFDMILESWNNSSFDNLKQSFRKILPPLIGAMKQKVKHLLLDAMGDLGSAGIAEKDWGHFETQTPFE